MMGLISVNGLYGNGMAITRRDASMACRECGSTNMTGARGEQAWAKWRVRGISGICGGAVRRS